MFDDSQVRYEISCLPEHCPIEGNAMCSGDDSFDRQCEERIRADLEDGNEWAWCCVRVTARYDGIASVVGQDYLGGCSYDGVEDFKTGGDYDDMKDMAKVDLYSHLEGILARFGCVNPADNSECVEGLRSWMLKERKL